MAGVWGRPPDIISTPFGGGPPSGAGRGGNMIALVTQETCGRVSMMLRLAGAKDVIVTEVS